jgi:hypothetical protein
MHRGNNPDYRMEATRAILNIMEGATAQQLMDIYWMDMTGQLCLLLECQERFIVHTGLRVLVAFNSGHQTFAITDTSSCFYTSNKLYIRIFCILRYFSNPSSNFEMKFVQNLTLRFIRQGQRRVQVQRRQHGSARV